MENGTWLNRILIATCLVTLVWRYVLIVILDSPASRTYYATDSRVDSIVFGCLLALLKNPIESLSPKLLNWKDYSILGASILALISTLIIRNGIFRETLRYSIQGIALAPLFYYSISQHNHCFFKILNNSLIRKLGQYSYSIYLIHFVVIVNLSGLQISVTMKVLTEIGLVILYASLIDIFIDKPFIRLRYAYR